MDEIRDMADAELFELIDNGGSILRLKQNEDFRLVDEACKRLSRMAYETFKKIEPDNKTAVIELQMMAKLYDNVLDSILNSIKQRAEVAFEEAKERGLVGQDER